MTGLDLEYKLRLLAEEALKNKITTLFTPAEKATLTNFLKYYGDPDILSFQVREILTPFYEIESQYSDTILYDNIAAFRQGRKNTVRLINLLMDKDHQRTLFDFSENVYTKLANQTFVASQRTLARVRDNIMANIAKSYQQGIGIKEAAKSLRKDFVKLNTFEATHIARTEINSAKNMGNYQTYYDYDISYHQWWTGQDARVRDTHKALQGQITSVGKAFGNGLMHPGDRTGPIKEWIHCRCTTVPYLMPLGFMAPMGQTTFFEGDIVKIPNFKIPRIQGITD